MLEAIWQGFLMSISPKVLGLMVIACFIGNFFGAVPGLGGNLALALLIPFVFGWEPFAGLAFLLSMHAVVHTGGSIPGILFAIPGTGPTVATIVDGYPMTKMGKGGQAMGAQLAASGLGGVIGAFVLALLIPVVRPIAIAFGSPEVLMLIVFGLTFVVILSRDSIPKGFMSAMLGLLLSSVGLNPHTGVGRYTFDQLWLWDGIHIVTLVLGLFAFAEMIDLGARGRGGQIAHGEVKMTWYQLWEGTLAVFQNWWLSLRTAIIGTFIGIIPGLGGDVATWVCYGHAVQTCKNNENFGKGDIRGVIAVETANNAKEGGALLPTIVFGIPGSSGMALLLGAFLILGITPGPQLLTNHLDLVWGMVWVLVISNIFAAISLYPISGWMGKLAYIRGSLLIPPIMFLAAIGASLIRGHWQDFLFVAFTGLLGFSMKKWKYPRPPMILGFILGRLAEDYLHKSLAAWGFAFLLRPVCFGLLLLSIASLGYSIWHQQRERAKKKKSIKNIPGEFYFTVFMFVLFVLGFYFSTRWGVKARLFPQLVVIIGGVISLWQLFKMKIVAKQAREAVEIGDEETEKAPGAVRQISTPRSEWTMILWVALFFTMTIVLGFHVSMVLYTVIFLYFFGRESWKTITLFTISLWVGIHFTFEAFTKTTLYGGVMDYLIEYFSG
ncbi:MAG: tripartite tricarboxylate transporter permease [Thermodesulfobacteriota bacterium]